MYAIIETGGKQYKVAAGDKVRVEKLDVEVGQEVLITDVLLVSGDTVSVGNPYVDGACVAAKVTDQGKGRKVIVYKYKPKTGYHKKNGHRQLYTELEIEKITLNGIELAAFAAEKAADAIQEKLDEKMDEISGKIADAADKLEEKMEAKKAEFEEKKAEFAEKAEAKKAELAEKKAEAEAKIEAVADAIEDKIEAKAEEIKAAIEE